MGSITSCDATIASLQADGLTINQTTAGGSLYLQRGALLLVPDVAITVSTVNGAIVSQPGAVVLLMADGHNVGVWDIHDLKGNDVWLQVSSRQFKLATGVIKQRGELFHQGPHRQSH